MTDKKEVARSAGDVMHSAYNLCPDHVQGQPARMRWIAEYFLANYRAAPSVPSVDSMVRQALQKLVDLKDHKDKCGKTPYYEARQVPAWEAARIALAAAPAAPLVAQQEPVELSGIAEVLGNGDGFWRECTGCYETCDGHPVGIYPYSEAFKCHLGDGCSECGGIGAVWDTTDYGAMADDMARGMGQEVAAPQAADSATDCPHAAPHRYCAQCPVSPCPIGLGEKK